jgi:UDP:flavonoid glycosyltransferase YjiC (YdhE family)
MSEIYEKLKKSKNLNIALVSIPEMGHCIPLIHLGEELVNRGHKVFFITMKYGNKSNL